MMNLDPRVSVVLPVYNGEKYLENALSSLVHQTYQNMEIIIINDGSTDNTEAIIKRQPDNRITTYRNDENLGIIASLNKGISVAQGEYIALMAADDICFPERIFKQVGFLDNHLDIDVLGTNIQTINEEGEQLSSSTNPNLILPIEPNIINWLLFLDVL